MTEKKKRKKKVLLYAALLFPLVFLLLKRTLHLSPAQPLPPVNIFSGG